MMDRYDYGLFGFIGLLIVFGVWVCHGAYVDRVAFDSKCEAAGGIPYHSRDGRICLNPDAIVKMTK